MPQDLTAFYKYFTKAWRYQVETTGVKVYEIVPALVDTTMTLWRGKSKMTAAQLADEFIKDFRNDKYESLAEQSAIFLFPPHQLTQVPG